LPSADRTRKKGRPLMAMLADIVDAVVGVGRQGF
jgi:hypothetical protein